jgi:hypothetical protein
MITGLKIVRGPGAVVTEKKTQEYGGRVGTGMSAAFGSSYIVDTGEMSGHQVRGQEATFGGSSDFVFAYRLSRISFTKDDNQIPVAKQERYTAGAMLGVKSERIAEDHVSEFMERLRVEGEDAVRRDLRGMESVTAIDEDDNKACECFVVPLKH